MSLISTSDIALLLIKKASELEGLKTPGVLGKKAFQKSLYFLNQYDDFFRFKWGDYGPLSGEIQQITEDLKAGGKIIINPIPTKKQGAIIQNMVFSKQNNDNFFLIKFPSELEDAITRVVKFLSDYTPRDLELFASVHYWAKKQQSSTDKYTQEYIFDKLFELKPHAGFTKKDIQKAMTILEHHRYLP